MRRSFLPLLAGKALKDEGRSPVQNDQMQSWEAGRVQSILSIRKSPKQVHRLGIQSHMLSTLPIVQRTLDKEKEWRNESLRQTTTAFMTEASDAPWKTTKDPVIEQQQKQNEIPQEINFLDYTTKYYAMMTSSACGLIMGFKIADYFFEDPHGVRLLYDPSVGFLTMIEKSEGRISEFSSILSHGIECHLQKNMSS
ncbi:SURF1 family protein [Perkinsela sp. CCAP 1560/4]|nr:SURF1 family protein [Perkinsela sp. CCAP 1560/4]|eukprot:KNH09775.1 SURF1 family protein [Perkinsela sp. CCAP 1560/4]